MAPKIFDRTGSRVGDACTTNHKNFITCVNYLRNNLAKYKKMKTSSGVYEQSSNGSENNYTYFSCMWVS